MIGEFLNYLQAQLGCIYVWGGQGETDITEEWIRGMETSEQNARRAIRLWRRRMAEGMSPIAAYDCSGLIVRFLLDKELIPGDLSSRGLYGICAKLPGRGDLKPGDLVFRHNGERIHHVGVYMGDGMALESKGRDDGVVLRGMDDSGGSYWNRYGRLEALGGAQPAAPLPDPAGPGEEYFPAEYGYGGATYVNLRTGPSAGHEIVGRVSRGETVLVLGSASGWAEVVKKGDRYIRGWCLERYLERN